MYMNLLFFFGFLVAGSTAKSCIAAQGPQAVKCLETFKNVAEAAGNYNLTDPASTIPTNEICGKFKRCAPIFACETEPKVTHAVNITILFCDAVGYFTNEFLPCQEKLDSRTTECTRAWDPFPKEIEDKKKMAEIRKEACKNYFGKDNCMKEEIIEVCGKQAWAGFRKAHLSLNTIIGACDHIDVE
ncbi:hypothetical protein CAEBREN_13631 [Caenorhabditis brenneri]|uniref:T20D4.11-like domain-containing protein n=1 Tax=Caenorhabditis brenneri TaxID=135651 RepID=G0NQN2_CAEBE|nr:hypothetical protein CAEBREN_13631 [Caenorhabditis brenneri]